VIFILKNEAFILSYHGNQNMTTNGTTAATRPAMTSLLIVSNISFLFRSVLLSH